MLTHNLLIAYRNFIKYKSSFFINLIGLSSGLACFLLIFLWVNDEVNKDQFLENSDRLFQVMENVDQGNGMITRITTAGPTAEAMAADFPEVELAVTATLDWGNSQVLSFEDNDIKATGIYASSAFFRVFSFKLLQGEPHNVLSDKKGIVISQALAIRLFGTEENVMGKVVEIQHKDQFQVTGLMEDLPNASSAKFEFVLTWEKFRDENEWVTNWFNTAPQTYVLLAKGSDVDTFNKKIFNMVRTKTEGKASHRSPFIRHYDSGYLHGRYENGSLAGGRIEYVRLFSIIAVFILFIACINFMNLSTAQASRRIKEVGIKKAVGARQRALVFQYLAESIMMTLFSLFIALLIVLLLLPQFNEITEKQLTLEFNLPFTLTMAAIVLVTGFVSGSYPALYLSKFNPASVLKGKLNNLVGEVWARKGLVMFQFTLSIILIVSVWVVYEQISFIQNRNLGYDKENIMIFSRE
ncbi:MAG: transporter permease, partial [Marivirga sp.]|nr:transporter permease [Marivirga sp.]